MATTIKNHKLLGGFVYRRQIGDWEYGRLLPPSGVVVKDVHQAYRISRLKWRSLRKLVNEGEVENTAKDFCDGGGDTCGFCMLYRSGTELTADCMGCPISIITGDPYCLGSPYPAALFAIDQFITGDRAYKDAVLRVIDEEIKFLRSTYIAYCKEYNLIPKENTA